MSDLDANVQRTAREITAGRGPQGAPRSWIEQARVYSVTAGGAANGTDALVRVSWRDDPTTPTTPHVAAYLSSYTPVAGHEVAVVVQPPGGLLILGRIIGTPPS